MITVTTPAAESLYDPVLRDRVRNWQSEALGILAAIEAEVDRHHRALAQVDELRGDVEATMNRMPGLMATQLAPAQ